MSYYEDMYVQASEELPGIIVDIKKHHITMEREKFYEELPRYFEECETPGYYELSERYSIVFDSFLSHDLQQLLLHPQTECRPRELWI